ncbi:unnamed protein product [Microthlaspi erraticum]|uniref:Proton pump-interactor 1 n=1 Tax=Microthlaspi erraticum TaxID=1685480 RepID=A0A6D2IAJ5_9BRAS|nr:unnamed protein product [Microthlaspi erraticum]
MEEIGLPTEPYEWYLDMRRYGTARAGLEGGAKVRCRPWEQPSMHDSDLDLKATETTTGQEAADLKELKEKVALLIELALVIFTQRSSKCSSEQVRSEQLHLPTNHQDPLFFLAFEVRLESLLDSRLLRLRSVRGKTGDEREVPSLEAADKELAKQILKEIRLLEGIANAAMRAKIKESMGQKDDIQGQVKLMGAGLDGVKKERQAISARIGQLSEKVKATKDEILVLENELKAVSEKRDKAYSNIHELRKQRDETNFGLYQGRNVLNKARDLATQKNITDLEALAKAEVEKFVTLWCSKKNFREDYEKRILASLDARQLSRDGRMRNPEEKPILAPEVPAAKAAPSKTEVVPKANAKQQPKEEPVSAPKPDASVAQKTEKAKDTAKVKKVVKDEDDDDEVYGLGKPRKEEVDEATVKEMRKQEEIAKAKQAMERKKMQAEEESKKKSGGNTEAEAVSEEGPEASDAEKEETEAPVEEKPQKEKVFKEKPIRNRIRSRGGTRNAPKSDPQA